MAQQESSYHEECSYRDYANESEDSTSLGENEKNKGSSSSSDNSSFPVKLHYMLSDMKADGLGHIVSWQPHGRCFIVHKPAAFADKILPL